MVIALTGATGNMGRETLAELVKLNNIKFVKILVLPEDKKRTKLLFKKCGKNKNKIQIVFGNLKDIDACRELVKDTTYVVNLARSE